MAEKYTKNVPNIPAEKFRFATGRDLNHDSEFKTKPVSYLQGAFARFSKNKGAVVGGIVIAMLLLFAIIAPFFTPFNPAYYDQQYSYVTPRLEAFVGTNIDFWDGCKVKKTNYLGYMADRATELETGREVIKHDEYTVSEDGSNYTYRYDTYYGYGFGKYKIISQAEYDAIQKYQNETGRQILYPVVKSSDRPTLEKNKYNANIYYKVENPNASTLRPKLDYEGNIVPNYWKYEEGDASALIPEYNSLRIEGQDGIKALKVNGVDCSEETVLDGTYAVQRPFVLVTREGETLSPAAQAFFDYATGTAANDLIRQAGAVPVAK